MQTDDRLLAKAGADHDSVAGMPRREFLRYTAGGMILSVLGVRTPSGAAEDVILSSAGCSLTLRLPESGVAQLRSLRNVKTGFEWCHADSPLEPVLISAGGQLTGWTGQPSRSGNTAGKQRVEFIERHPTEAVSARYTLQSVQDFPVAELQVEFQNTGSRPLEGVTAFGALRFRLRDDLGQVKVHQDGVGLAVVEAVGTGEFLLIGMEWGGCEFRIERGNGEAWLNAEVRGSMGMSGVDEIRHDMAPGEQLRAPRVFLGVTHGDLDEAFLTARHYLQRHVFPKPPKHWPWVHYNFWSTDAHGVQEAFLREIDFAAALGIELITQDASWYEGSAKVDKPGLDPWEVGLGHYTDDRVKYPMGLAAISRRVHEKGMKFGLWVGPNIVDPRVVGSLIKEEWLCKHDGKLLVQKIWGPENAPVQVCLGCPGYIEHLKQELSGIVQRFQLDALRWDNSGTTDDACNRTDHGHQAGDWAYASLRGEQEVFEHLHAKFPDLVIEYCSGPDYRTARTVRAFGGDDRGHLGTIGTTTPSSPYPASYTGAWLITPPEKSAVELDSMFRGQMAAWFGFGMINGRLVQRVSLYPQGVLDAARRNIPLYKRFRHLLNEDAYRLLPDQHTGEDPWRAVQFVTPAGDEAVVLAFRNGSPRETVQVPLRGLAGERSYELTFANTGVRSHARGVDLLRDGLTLSLSQLDMSEVILLRPLSG